MPDCLTRRPPPASDDERRGGGRCGRPFCQGARNRPARQGLFAPDEATAAFGELLQSVVDAERFPALRRAVEGGAFAPQEGDLYAPFDFGLELMLDGIERLIERQTRS